jgi:hypothetical protein
MLENKISDIIFTPGLTNIARVVRICKAVGGDISELSKVLDIPQEILASELENKVFEEQKSKSEIPTFKQYAKIFFDGYSRGSGVKWTPLGKDFAQLKNLMKLLCLEDFEKVMNLYVCIKKDIEIKKKVDFDLGNFARNISPGYIVSKINFLKEHVNAQVQKKEKNYEKTKL